MDYSYIKALHVVFIVTWFAGLFYMVRLFIYTKEASAKEEPAKSILTAQLLIMQKKLWFIITWPSLILTLIFGPWMLYLNPTLLTFPWMWLKLIFVGLLTLYHLQCHAYYKQQQSGIFKPSSFKLRMFNELATVFLVAIVFLIIVRSTSGLVWGMIGLFIFAALLMGVVYIYKKQRQTMAEKRDGTIPPEKGPK
ncbi:MAG: protoporphyrinogen oxidase [Bacteroidota bacterium]|jgi:putative membrane protein|nr:protoporphyrinogen oxidase [Bacteroidota bacterium]